LLLLRILMNNSYCGSSSLSCVVLLQHCVMLRGHMSTHGSCGMVFVIHNQSFPILSITFSYNFLLDVMIHNTFHLLRLEQSTIAVWSLTLKNAHVLVVILQVSQNFWLHSNSTNNSSLRAYFSTCSRFFSSSPRSLSTSLL
jgi:hypothetical protein